jgi:hypothetical protein
MNQVITFTSTELTPSRDAILENQGIPRGKVVSPEIENLHEAAVALLRQHAEPVGVVREIGTTEFAGVFDGEGQNGVATPVADIYGRADALALFALTLGANVSHEITRLFASSEFALGAMLDAAASAAADHLANVLARRYADTLSHEKRSTADTRVLAYSPGYCGWHITGQRKLFGCLQPEQIGITLTDTCLMQPLKSVSGVLIAAASRVHLHEMSYPCCAQCTTRGCRDRIRAVMAPHE